MSFSSPHHSFDINLASRYGINCAIIIHHFQHWIALNRRRQNKRSFQEGSWWTYQTQQEICDHFPYLSRRMVRTVINTLVEENVLKIGNFNKIALDKTTWYAFVDEKLWLKEEIEFARDEDKDSNNFYESAERANGCAERANAMCGKGQAIPDTKEICLREDGEESALARAKEAAPKASLPPPLLFENVKIEKQYYENLIRDFGQDLIDKYVKKLNTYSLTQPKKFKAYSRHDMVIRDWMDRDGIKKINTDNKEDDMVSWLKKTIDTDMIDDGKVVIGRDYVEFIGQYEGYIKATDPKFKEKVEHFARKIRSAKNTYNAVKGAFTRMSV